MSVSIAIYFYGKNNCIYFYFRKMVDCSQRVALVLGGAGNVGSGVVGGFLRRGYGKVVVISRNPERMGNLQKQYSDAENRLVCILGDIGSEESAAAARAEVSWKLLEFIHRS